MCHANELASPLKNGFNFSKSWLQTFDFKTPDWQGGLHMMVMVGDDEGGHDAEWIRYDGQKLFVATCNAQTNIGTEIIATVTPELIQRWTNLTLVYDAVLVQMELYLDYQLVEIKPCVQVSR